MTQRTVTVPVSGDASAEADETFDLYLSSVDTNAVTATATIIDDDTPAGQPGCGTPSFNKATQAGVFIYNDCGTNNWHLRVTGGGQTLTYRGQLSSSQLFSNLLKFLIKRLVRLLKLSS